MVFETTLSVLTILGLGALGLVAFVAIASAITSAYSR